MNALGIDIGGSCVKAALLRDGEVVATGMSARYSRPDLGGIAGAIGAALPAEARLLLHPPEIGVCAPGLSDAASQRITKSINMPALEGVDLRELLERVLGRPAAGLTVRTDAHAAATDFRAKHPEPGRLLAVSLGTGVGACVLDDGRPVRVTGSSPGHLGQMDVTVEEASAPVGPDGGRGSLEAYIGLPALTARYGPGLEGAFLETSAGPPLRALARALRIAHAIYRPDQIALLGGVGLLMSPVLPVLRGLVADGLTSLARDGWTLRCGDHVFHAAAGAARLSLAAATGSG